MLQIGTVSIDGRLVLAPLAGYSDLPFRLLCREFGAALCVSEMISCHGLAHRQKRTLRMLDSHCDEKPISFQLFGSDAEVMGEAAAILAECKPDIIDINMGCPVRKVTKRGAGAALMGDIKLAERIIRRVVLNTTCPVTVKIRSGVDGSTINGVEFARMAEMNGISGIAVHGRTWKQAFSGKSDWKIVASVKQAVSIPVIGNGDITSYERALERMNDTGCDGVMIGRAALGNPWIFSPDRRAHNLSQVIETAARHIQLVESYNPRATGFLAPIKNHLGRYFKGFPGCAEIRSRIYGVKSWDILKQLITELQERSLTDFTSNK